MGSFRLWQIISFWATILIEGSSRWRRSVSCQPTKSNIPKISFFSVETTNAQDSIESMVSMMNASANTASNCGSLLSTSSIAYQWVRTKSIVSDYTKLFCPRQKLGKSRTVSRPTITKEVTCQTTQGRPGRPPTLLTQLFNGMSHGRRVG